MPFSCAASSAAAIWRAMASASLCAIGPSAITICQRRAVDQLEHESRSSMVSGFLTAVALAEVVSRTAFLFDAVDLRDVRMVERRKHLRLALESRDAIGVGGEEIGQNLDRDVAVQPRIARPIHFAHSAGANGGEDFVRAETRAGFKGHALGETRADYK